ncbi:MAG: c-type cytochrome [Rhodospirillaceae bacterium]|jgi:DMSO reductase family type II enzyme heme b subunit|nr:c-type cytochrome [Rhodospirillaceae bacterium]MBT4425982.1 c-type cytochrome [Rhodospirillaceae bacterium]MBT5040528.1 c-type cytochrome [Rhodospirillaceae bacterium]MBT5677146.1 c-type cytochrome [Rhodospirillaceae bacterium]MBT5780282.1 c-type cytochrome [Rhodospirillaceae bacterium]
MFAARTLFAFSCLVLLALIMLPSGAQAQSADADNGEVVYFERCVGCHGDEGDGLGPAAERLNPPPRDFTLGQYKFKTTGFDDIVPNDVDLIRMIRDGMPGTAMPGWSDVLSDQEILDLVAYIKIFAALDEETPSDQVDYGSQIATSPESIAKGRELFLQDDRCAECHGQEGRGDAIKKLKDDNGERTWPRNLTKPWTFRASNAPKDIFSRISVGIPGTQMPSFADPVSKKKLTIEERWHVANYVASLAETKKVVAPEKTVIKALKVSDALPTSPEDALWQTAESATFFLVPQIIAEQRFFMPSNDTVTVRALFDDETLALLVEWDDRTKSIPGDAKAESIANAEMSEDAIAVQFPVTIPSGMEKPYFLMGDAANPVNLWHWSSGSTEAPETVSLMDASGAETLAAREAAPAGMAGEGVYRDGTWRVVLRRALTTGDAENDTQFAEGTLIPVSIFAWDGSNSEVGSKHTLTTWYWLRLGAPGGGSSYIAAIIVALSVGALELWWLYSVRRRRVAGQT